MEKIDMPRSVSIALLLLSLIFSLTASANEDVPAPLTLFTNVSIFNGSDGKLYENHHVLVEGNRIKSISDEPITVEGEATVIDGGGKTLMPGMIDGHAHIMINASYGSIETNMDITDLAYRATIVVERFLMDGFTSVRDMGGPAFGLMRNINTGMIMGPRVFPSGAFISQTSGHGDFRDRNDSAFSINDVSDLSNFERMGIGMVADGVPEVLAATRLNLRHGATQIKIMAGGGGSSRFDPIDTTQYSRDEVCAIVEAAKDWNTYVSAHVFTDRSMNRLIECGVKSFDHGFFMTEKTMKKIAKEGIFVVPQMWGLSPDLAKNPLMPKDKLPAVAKLQEEYGDFGKNLLKHDVKVVFASDYVGEFADAERARRYELWWRSQAFGSNFEVLKQLTSTAGELLALSGPRNPYASAGKLGVIEVDAAADILIIDGNPLEDISVIGGNEKWFDADPEWKPIDTIQLIMKDGVIFKNTLQ
jgi:imidazolonepropionase-like amidohydrolase